MEGIHGLTSEGHPPEDIQQLAICSACSPPSGGCGIVFSPVPLANAVLLPDHSLA
jgi:hypothetical protein